MGKRKERRLAALSNAGRRVKLDLFAEPSGELGGSTVHGDAGGDIDSRHRDGLPDSPSSSGQQPQNPLLLLGQYSDDEVDEESSKGPDDTKVQGLMLNEEVKGALDEGSKDADNSVSVDLVTQNNGQQNTMQNSTSLDVECSEKNESDVASGKLQSEMVSKDQMYSSENFDERVVTDISSGWKMVMHEESQRYYYWNIETGETSWEVPQVLAQAKQLTNDSIPPASVNDKTDVAAVGIDNSNVVSAVVQNTSASFTIDGSMETSVTCHKESYDHGSQMNGSSDKFAKENQGSDVNGNELIRNDGLTSFSSGGDHSFVSEFNVEEQQLEIDLPSRLVKQSESLLERLKSLKKSNGNLQGQDSLSKYMLEIEIRLSDFRSLASYGSSLLPFWVHSDRKMKLLESLINDDLLQAAKSTHEVVEDKSIPVSEGLDEQQNGIGHGSEVDHNENTVNFLTSEVPNGSQANASSVVSKDINDKIPTNDQPVALSNSSRSHMETVVEVNTQVEATINHEESTHKHGYNVGEDVDMDVDMEVEDMNSSGNASIVDVSVAKGFVHTEQPVQLNPVADCHSLLPEDEFVVPPPPDDEWIPPPPPDNEQVPPPPPPDNDQMPPPPPGDPIAPSYHALPSYTETGQPLTYAQYNLSYSGASSEYYGQTAVEFPNCNIYGQIAMPPSQLYYSAVPNIYSENSQVMINPTDPVAYYEVQDGAGSKPVPAINTNDSGVVGGADRASSDVPSTSSSIHAPAAVSVDNSVPLPPATAEASADNTTSSLVAKAQTKVVRSRKRAVAVGSSLKSNKKVSSLVNKWKAAKEELLEEEEEPESVYEVLERKRQREIEEWHAKQIASGEAKDNANFQPLGGDWRERVKRKRAQAARESVDTLQDTTEHNQQQPDLIELSKGLPSNWQAYWDETSKQVYYGNTITSETTWTRPTR
ncbi:WW domain [Sesbania bispinosa]|nr:WW domain [Sesbania bispinosa]